MGEQTERRAAGRACGGRRPPMTAVASIAADGLSRRPRIHRGPIEAPQFHRLAPAACPGPRGLRRGGVPVWRSGCRPRAACCMASDSGRPDRPVHSCQAHQAAQIREARRDLHSAEQPAWRSSGVQNDGCRSRRSQVEAAGTVEVDRHQGLGTEGSGFAPCHGHRQRAF
jgi:hypothetical protein